jgi:hypothetical protein
MDVRKDGLLKRKRNPLKGRSNGWHIKGKDTRGHNP